MNDHSTAPVISDYRTLVLAPGEARRVWLGVGSSWMGPAHVPLYVARGTQIGPKFVVLACQHGDEGYGVLALLDLMNALDPAQLRGELVLAPCTNLFGFTAGNRVSPFDYQDMNRVHPGKPDGTLTEQIVHALVTQVLPGADLLLDLHGGSPENGDISFGRWTDAPGKPSPLEIARCLDLTFLLARAGDTPGMLTSITPGLGIPQLSIESGSCVHYARDNAAAMTRMVMDCMLYLGMIDGPRPVPRDIPFRRTISRRAHTGGVWKTLVSMGEAVQKGQTLGHVMDLVGHTVQTVTAGDDAIVAVMRTGVRVHPGESLITIAAVTSPEER